MMLVAGFGAVLLFIVSTTPLPDIFTSPSSTSSSSITTGGLYGGYQYWNQNQTLAVKTVIETPFARTQLHKVLLPDGQIVNDWLWFDERDAINVLVRTHAQQGEGKFIVFEQNKYGLSGVSLAPIGGFIEDGETPRDAAERELREETGLQSQHWTELGAYRTGANRGGGIVHTFLATDALPHPSGRLKSPDLEAQRMLTLSQEELLTALRAGRFKEVKWTATIALALLDLKHSAL